MARFQIKNKNVDVQFINSVHGFQIKWNDKPLDKWDTYLYVTKVYKQKSKWQSCWEDIENNFKEKTTPNDICKIVSKYGKYRGFYAAG